MKVSPQYTASTASRPVPVRVQHVTHAHGAGHYTSGHQVHSREGQGSTAVCLLVLQGRQLVHACVGAGTGASCSPRSILPTCHNINPICIWSDTTAQIMCRESHARSFHVLLISVTLGWNNRATTISPPPDLRARAHLTPRLECGHCWRHGGWLARVVARAGVRDRCADPPVEANRAVRRTQPLHLHLHHYRGQLPPHAPLGRSLTTANEATQERSTTFHMSCLAKGSLLALPTLNNTGRHERPDEKLTEKYMARGSRCSSHKGHVERVRSGALLT